MIIPEHPSHAGTELYPRIGPFDIKTWTNCRMGMMSWTFITICFAYKQAELYGSVSNSMLVSITLSSPFSSLCANHAAAVIHSGCLLSWPRIVPRPSWDPEHDGCCHTAVTMCDPNVRGCCLRQSMMCVEVHDVCRQSMMYGE
jgi:hypothetical protein